MLRSVLVPHHYGLKQAILILLQFQHAFQSLEDLRVLRGWVELGGRGDISVPSYECLKQIGNSLEGNLRHEFRVTMCIQTIVDAFSYM